MSVSAGIGYATQVVIAYAAVSYIVIQAWAFFYLFSSFSAEVPWASCRNPWNTGGHEVMDASMCDKNPFSLFYYFIIAHFLLIKRGLNRMTPLSLELTQKFQEIFPSGVPPPPPPHPIFCLLSFHKRPVEHRGNTAEHD